MGGLAYPCLTLFAGMGVFVGRSPFHLDDFGLHPPSVPTRAGDKHSGEDGQSAYFLNQLEMLCFFINSFFHFTWYRLYAGEGNAPAA